MDWAVRMTSVSGRVLDEDSPIKLRKIMSVSGMGCDKLSAYGATNGIYRGLLKR